MLLELVSIGSTVDLGMSFQIFMTRDDFEQWLAQMDDFLDEYRESFPEDERALLDFSPASLDVVESWILKTYPDTDSMLKPAESRRVNRVACYIGETFRKKLGGKWEIRLSDPKFAFYSLPILVGTGDPECPLTLATAAANRRSGHYLRTVLDNS